MKLDARALGQHLKERLAPIYIVAGDEPLLVMETVDAIRAAAREQGYSEREVFHAERGFDWASLAAESSNLSLFAEQRILELRLPTGKPGDAGSKALQAYAADASPEDLLILITPKLDQAQQRSKWFKALDAAGVFIPLWPPTIQQLPAWVRQRMQGRGLQPEDEAVGLLVDRIEGNLLAAEQEMEKLLLLHGTGPISAEQVADSVASSARFDIFGLVDAALNGEHERCVRMVGGVREEGIEPILVLWALSREVRSLAAMAREVEQGQSVDRVIAAHRVWEKRKPFVRQGLTRHNASRWQALLRRCGHIDRMIKGAAAGNPWDELLELTLLMAGVRLFARAARRPA
ncbi:MAG: DNA polymerase III subunit delta [Gammaproteobacteria bacterium]|nr:DNA polymerase III subunit delta [Gammaproteobacteria bacterium]